MVDSGKLSYEMAHRIINVKNIRNDTLPAGRSIKPGELAALLNACPGDPLGVRDAAIIAILYGCGLRRAELVKLDLVDFDQETGELKILHAKGSKQRVAYVVNGAGAALEDWLAIRGDAAGPLFCQVLKGGHVRLNRLTTQAVYHLLQARSGQARIPHISPLDFRRTFAGNLLDSGIDISTIQKLMGHADISTTVRYDRRGEEVQKRAASLLRIPYNGRL